MSMTQLAVLSSGSLQVGPAALAHWSQIERLESDDLGIALSAFGASDIDPIVKIMMANGFTFAQGGDVSPAVSEIVEKLRLWGSENLKGAKQLRTYREIIEDACQGAGVKITDEMTAFEMEQLLLKDEFFAEKPEGALGSVVKGAARAAAGLGGKRLFGSGIVAGAVSKGLSVAASARDKFGPGAKPRTECVLEIAQARLRLWCAAVAMSSEI